MLNDFIFCPYSIYLHNVYMDADEGLYHAKPQTQGRIAHNAIDNKTASKRKDDLLSLPVYSSKYKLMGKIDVYNKKEKLLVEYKYQLKHIFQGQIYQLWAQYFCLREMGYDVTRLAFYETSTNKMIPVQLPQEDDRVVFENFIQQFHNFSPESTFPVNANKCRHCIYSNLCDKSTEDNVY